MHISLDGFVAGPGGDMSWIHVDDEIFDYVGDRTDNSDTALYGRITWEMMEGYWPTAGDQPGASKHDIQHSTWYNKVEKVVISKSLQGKQLKNTTIISSNLTHEINQLKDRSKKEILIFGSPGASHSLMADNLIDEYWLFVNPILLGEGTPLFKNIKDRIKLRFVKSQPFTSGVVCLHYEI